MILITKPLIRRDKRDTLSILVQFLLKPWVQYLVLPPLLPCYSLDNLG